MADAASIERAFDIAFKGMCEADNFEDFEHHFGHALGDFYRLFELAKRARSGKSERRAALEVSEDGRGALAVAWSRNFRTHELIEVTEVSDRMTEFVTNLVGTLEWRQRSSFTRTDRHDDLGLHYDAHLAGRPVLDTLRTAFRALRAIT